MSACLSGTFQMWSCLVIPGNYLELYQSTKKHCSRNLSRSWPCKEMNEWEEMNEMNGELCSPHCIWKTLWLPSTINHEELLLNTHQWDVYNLYDVFEANTAKLLKYEWFSLDHKHSSCDLSWIIARGFLARTGVKTFKVFPGWQFYCWAHWGRKVPGSVERFIGGLSCGGYI